MRKEKIKSILEAMQGITYLEWKKLKNVIEENFNKKAGNLSNKIEIASSDEIISEFEKLF